MISSLWTGLAAELDRWSEDARRLHLWLRDDDAVAPTPQLSRLARMSERFAIPVLLAVIPMLAEEPLRPALAAAPLLLPCQHGCRHLNHAPPGAKKSEFGPRRDPGLVAGEIAAARNRLHDLLGDGIVPIFVPPWNRIDPLHAAHLPARGFAGLSCFHGDQTAAGLLRLLHTDLDVMDWRGGRKGRDHDDLLGELIARLEAMRSASSSESTLGILLHHRDHDDTVWTFLDALLELCAAHPAVSLADPRRLLTQRSPRETPATM